MAKELSHVVERFLRYVKVDTQSIHNCTAIPTTEKQKDLARMLIKELEELGAVDVRMCDAGCVYATIPANCETDAPVVGFIAHMDTTPDASGTNVTPRIIENYDGKDIVLNEEKDIVMRTEVFEHMLNYVGQDLIVTDGTTLLGADDKAGVAEIVTLCEMLIAHPEIKHRPIAVCFTPDEEIGRGTDRFRVERFPAKEAYTVDGGELGEIEYENFNAASATVTVHGLNIHPGSAKNKMKNAALLLAEFIGLLPAAETPAHTEGYEGFFHLCEMSGDESSAEAAYIIRDHDREKFEARKTLMAQTAEYMNQKYGPGTFTLQMTDSYYNMKEMLTGHMHLIRNAEAAMQKAGVTPQIVAIRGGTDGARLSYEGLPCPNLSTGGLNFHSIHEFIPIPAMEKMVEVLRHLVTL